MHRPLGVGLAVLALGAPSAVGAEGDEDRVVPAEAPSTEGAREARLDTLASQGSWWDQARVGARWLAEADRAVARGDREGAARAYTAASLSPAPVAAIATWGAARHALVHGDAALALGHCTELTSRWPSHPHAVDCAQLAPWAHASLATDPTHAHAATRTAAMWDDTHPKEPIGESVALAVARVQALHTPEHAIPVLRDLATTFTAPLTGRLAAETLADLRSRGHADAVVPDGLDARAARARSLQATGQRDAAWNAFAAVVQDAADAPALRDTLEDEAEDVAWSTRRYDALVDRFQAQGPPSDDGDVAWSLYRALDRGGRAAEALAVGMDAMAVHARHRRWRGAEEAVARTAMFAGDHAQARALFDTCANGWSGKGRRCRFYAAFNAVLTGDTADARTRLDAIIAHDAGLRSAARYWRARLLSTEDPESAAADRAWIVAHAPEDDWYGTLVRTGFGAAPIGSGPLLHRGRWPDVAVPPPRPAEATLPGVRPSASPPWFIPARPAPRAEPRTDIPWPAALTADEAQSRAHTLARAWSDRSPDLAAAVAMADHGLRDDAGPLLSRALSELSAHDARAWKEVSPRDRLAVLLHTGCHHDLVRHGPGLTRALGAEPGPHITFPIAHQQTVWAQGKAHDVDPYLALAIMRTESLYDPLAVSYAGARGAMQIMPRTGHLLADRTDDFGFTVAALHDPDLAIAYGVRYLGLLLDRFDGVFPLAVAAYNGGPHNVSAWLDTLGPDMPMDVFVEHIPFGQTRRYVRKVTAVYAAYVDTWGSPGARVMVPPRALGDDPSVVDF